MREPLKPRSRMRQWWKVLLALPYLALCFPSLYAKNTPALFGFPYFYWYQFAWVVISSALMGFVYWQLKSE